MLTPSLRVKTKVSPDIVPPVVYVFVSSNNPETSTLKLTPFPEKYMNPLEYVPDWFIEQIRSR